MSLWKRMILARDRSESLQREFARRHGIRLSILAKFLQARRRRDGAASGFSLAAEDRIRLLDLVRKHPDSTVDDACGPAMAAALEALARNGGPSGIDDPVEWQRETRAERSLPGRSE